MPWKECEREEARWKFVQAVLARQASFAALGREHGISRECGHKWWRRFRAGGSKALGEKTRQPHCVRGQQQRWRVQLVALRRRQPTWGPDKLRWWLKRAYPHTRVPVPRTLGRWLAQAGLTRRNRRRSLPGPQVAGERTTRGQATQRSVDAGLQRQVSHRRRRAD